MALDDGARVVKGGCFEQLGLRSFREGQIIAERLVLDCAHLHAGASGCSPLGSFGVKVGP